MTQAAAAWLLAALCAAAPAQKEGPADGERSAVLKILSDYRAAMEAKSVEKLAAMMAPDLLVLEGVHKNVGWPDYRDNHIGPEMAEWERFKTLDPKLVEIVVDGRLAYAVEESTAVIVAEGKTTTLAAAETFILKKDLAGWKIRHLHFSGKKRVPPSAPQEPR